MSVPVVDLREPDLQENDSRKLVAAAPYLIEQDWAAYTPEQHAIWRELVTRRMPQLREHACSAYLEGFEQIGLQEDLLPVLKKVSERLEPRTGWNSTAVSCTTCGSMSPARRAIKRSAPPRRAEPCSTVTT